MWLDNIKLPTDEPSKNFNPSGRDSFWSPDKSGKVGSRDVLRELWQGTKQAVTHPVDSAKKVGTGAVNVMEFLSQGTRGVTDTIYSPIAMNSAEIALDQKTKMESQLFQQYKAETDPTKKSRLLKALKLSSDTKVNPSDFSSSIDKTNLQALTEAVLAGLEAVPIVGGITAGITKATVAKQILLTGTANPSIYRMPIQEAAKVIAKNLTSKEGLKAAAKTVAQDATWGATYNAGSTIAQGETDPGKIAEAAAVGAVTTPFAAGTLRVAGGVTGEIVSSALNKINLRKAPLITSGSGENFNQKMASIKQNGFSPIDAYKINDSEVGVIFMGPGGKTTGARFAASADLTPKALGLTEPSFKMLPAEINQGMATAAADLGAIKVQPVAGASIASGVTKATQPPVSQSNAQTPAGQPVVPAIEPKFNSVVDALNDPVYWKKIQDAKSKMNNGKVTSTSSNLYHTTSADNLESIKQNGLTTGNKPRFEGVSSPNSISFSANESGASYYGKPNDVMIRTKSTYKPTDLQPDLLAGGKGVYTTSKNIPASELEVKVKNKWQPLVLTTEPKFKEFDYVDPLKSTDEQLKNIALNAKNATGEFTQGEIYDQVLPSGTRKVLVSGIDENGMVNGWYMPDKATNGIGIDFFQPARFRKNELQVGQQVDPMLIKQTMQRVFAGKQGGVIKSDSKSSFKPEAHNVKRVTAEQTLWNAWDLIKRMKMTELDYWAADILQAGLKGEKAHGMTYNDNIYLSRNESTEWTGVHEVVHITTDHMNEIKLFTNAGLTHEKLFIEIKDVYHLNDDLAVDEFISNESERAFHAKREGKEYKSKSNLFNKFIDILWNFLKRIFKINKESKTRTPFLDKYMDLLLNGKAKEWGAKSGRAASENISGGRRTILYDKEAFKTKFKESTPNDQASYETAVAKRNMFAAISDETINKFRRLATTGEFAAGTKDVSSLPGFDVVAQDIRDLTGKDYTDNEILDKLLELPTKTELEAMRPKTGNKRLSDADRLQRAFGDEIEALTPTGESDYFLARKYSTKGTKNDDVLFEATPTAYQGSKRSMYGYFLDMFGIPRQDIRKIELLAKEKLGYIDKTFDLFGGSGMVTSIFKNLMPWSKQVLSEFDPEVVNMYRMVDKNPEEVKRLVQAIYMATQKADGVKWEYQLQQIMPDIVDAPEYKAAKMIFESRMGRGSGVNEIKLQKMINGIDNFHELLQEVSYGRADYHKMFDLLMNKGDEKTLVNLDPPYLWSTGYKAGTEFETAKGFIGLIDDIIKLNEKGIKVIYTNAEPRFVAPKRVAFIEQSRGEWSKLSEGGRELAIARTEQEWKTIEAKIEEAQAAGITVMRNVRPKDGANGRLEIVFTNLPDAQKFLKNEKQLNHDIAAILQGDIRPSNWKAQELVAASKSMGRDVTAQFAQKTTKAGDIIPIHGPGGEMIPDSLFEHIVEWKDKGSAYDTEIRIIEKNTGKDAPAIKKYLITNRANAVTAAIDAHKYMLTSEQAYMKELGITNKKLSAAVQDFGEKVITLDELKEKFPKKWEDVLKADAYFRKQYNELLDVLNAQRKLMGRDEIPKRVDYYTHFQEVSNIFEYLNQTSNIDPRLVGVSEFTSPNSPFNKFALQRKGAKHTADAITSFESYLPIAIDEIYMTPEIIRHRMFAQAVAEKTIETKNLNKFVTTINDYGDILANKSVGGEKSFLRRFIEEKGEKIISLVTRQFSRNTIMYSVGSAIMQTAGLPQAVAQNGGLNVARSAIVQIYSALSGRDTAIERSKYLRRRYTYLDRTFPSLNDKIQRTGALLFNLVERNVTTVIWRSTLDRIHGMGIKGDEAIQLADEITEKLTGGRAKGEKPIAWETKLGQLMLMFQLEVNNLVKIVTHDIPFQHGRLKGLYQALKLIAALFVFNTVYNETIGRTPLPDPIRAIDDAVKIYKSEKKKGKKGQPVLMAGGRLAGEVLSSVAGGQLLANTLPDYLRKKYFGRSEVGIYPGGIPAVTAVTKAITEPKDLIFTMLFPSGGRQFQKTGEGLTAYLEGKVTDKNDKLMYRVKQTPDSLIRSLLFGKTGTKEAQKYYNK